MKDLLKKAGNKLLGCILNSIGCFLWTLYDVVSGTIQSIFDFIVAGFFLYISWGIIFGVIALVLWLITKALGEH